MLGLYLSHHLYAGLYQLSCYPKKQSCLTCYERYAGAAAERQCKLIRNGLNGLLDSREIHGA